MIAVMAKKKPSKTIWTPRRLKALRGRLGLTQESAADRLGISPNTWIAWENAQRNPGSAAAKLLTLLENGQL